MSLLQFIMVTMARLNPLPFVLGWLESRPWRLLGFGAPVVVVVVATLAIRIRGVDPSSTTLYRRYMMHGAQSMEAGDDQGAELRFRRAEMIVPGDTRARYALATLADKRGETAKAMSMMDQLAEEPGEMRRPANTWLIARTPQKELSIEGRQTLIRRLERAADDDPDNLDLKVRLAQVYVQLGVPEKAIEFLKAAAEKKPQLRLPLVQLYYATGQKESAQAALSDAAQFFRDRVAKQPTDYESRTQLVMSLVGQRKYGDAVKSLQQALSLNDTVTVRRDIATVYAAWASDERKAGADSAKILELTTAALQSDPSNSASLLLLMEVSRDSKVGPQATEILEKQLAEGQSPWLIHMILGTRQLEQGKLKEGADHLEQAIKLNGSTVIALNNLAWTLAMENPPELSRAEQLITQAIQLAPDNPQVRETRGQIYRKQARWKEALTDLESVLPIYTREEPLHKQLPGLHQSLAEIYDKLGNPEMSKRHRELAEPAAKP